jgi:hypothetical protein
MFRSTALKNAMVRNYLPLRARSAARKDFCPSVKKPRENRDVIFLNSAARSAARYF